MKALGLSLLSITLLTLMSFTTPKSSMISKNTDEINWLNMEEAEKIAQKNPDKKIFIDVYTDWCSWCKVMDRSTFSNKEVIEYVNKNYIAVKLNAESKKEIEFRGQKVTEQQLAASMRVSSYPTIVLAGPNFKYITPIPGYRKAKEFRSMLEEFHAYQEPQ